MKFSKVTSRGSEYIVGSHENATVKIYSSTNKVDGANYENHCVTYTEGGKRVRRRFGDLAIAKAEAERVLIAMANGATKAITLTNADAEAYVLAITAITPTGINLVTAAREYRHAFDLLQGKASIGDAVRHYVATVVSNGVVKTVPEVYAAFLVAREGAGLSKIHLKDLRLRGSRFAKAFNRPIGEIGSDELNAWLRKIPGSNRNRNNMAGVIANMFNFARFEKWLPQNKPTAAEFIIRAKKTKGAIEVFTPAEASLMLNRVKANRPDLLPFLALGLFTGIRTEELKRLTWAAVNLDEGHVGLNPADTKLGARRIVPIQPNLAAWLKPYAKSEGPISVIGKAVETIAKVIDASNEAAEPAVVWKRNAMRHSYASYRLRATSSADTVALEMGNSPRMIQQAYHKLVTPAQAAEFWAIAP